MKAMVYEQYGPPEVLRFREVEKPVPGDKDVLIRVSAASLNAADGHLIDGTPFFLRFMSGLFKPKHTIPGSDIAGTVEAVGREVTLFRPGDRVFGDISGCGWGGFAEYAAAREDILAPLPREVSYEDAAAVPMAAVTALQGLRKGRIREGQIVAVNGASGGVGSFAVQIAKALGAEVTAVCSTGKIDAARSFGADHTVDYTVDDFTASGQQYDLILGVNGYHPLKDYKRALNARGIYVMIGGTGKQIAQAMIQSRRFSEKGGRTMTSMGVAVPSREDLLFIAALLQEKKIVPPIDRLFSLEETPEALRILQEGHAAGKLVISLDRPS